MEDSPSVQATKMDNAAAHLVSEATELLNMIGSRISTKSSLLALCLVNHRFNDIFSQFLYRRLSLTNSILQPTYLFSLTHNPYLRLTQVLSLDLKDHGFDHQDSFDLSHTERRGLEYDGLAWVQEGLMRVVQKCQNLHTLRIDGKRSLVQDDGTIIKLAGRALTRSPKTCALQCLALKMGNVTAFQLNASDIRPYWFLEGKLRSLSLLNLGSRNFQHRGYGRLCQIIKASPGLRYLALSVRDSRTLWQLRDICKDYKQMGGTPLKLKVLHLGQGLVLDHPSDYHPVLLSGKSAASSLEDVPPSWPGSPRTLQGVHEPPQAVYIGFLTDPKCLEELYATTYHYELIPTEFAWGTLSSSFLPMLKSLHLNINKATSMEFGEFLQVDGALDFLNRLHIHLDGNHCRGFGSLRNMCKNILTPEVPRDLSTALSPRGFSFLHELEREHRYKTVKALHLPNTDNLAISLYYPHLGIFAKNGLTRMMELKHLMLKLYVRKQEDWDGPEEVDKNQREAVILAGITCPKLRYVKMEICYGESPGWERELYGRMSIPGGVIGLSRSWTVIREVVGGKTEVKARLLDAKEAELACPEGLWSEERKMDKYVDVKEVPLQQE